MVSETRTYTSVDQSTWEIIKGAALVGIVGAAIGGVVAYFKSIGNKVDKAEFKTAIAEVRAEVRADIEKTNRRISQWEEKLGGFARQSALDEVKTQITRMESRLETSIKELGQQLFALIAAGRDK
jgi:ribosomal protein S20